ncbi:hypothetical protein QEP73_14060 [Pseudomonas defluvii]|jgi:hypothetical protein|uniref:hypothetical protein n=1 Tax=Pseudomonas sp. AL 58 TaxID=3104275 RepID=UPI0029247754|nr:hypothetical protein [Pseudomonas sp. AL 58]WJM94719.1 hypothetical protein QEP73_14060 [Pseudomonas defluvii]
MSLTLAIFMLIGAWLSVAAAMLWGVLRITRRHHHPYLQPRDMTAGAPHRQRRHAHAH